MSATTTIEVGMLCPHCGTKQECLTGLAEEHPTPGDVVVCLDCAGLQIFTGDGVRMPDVTELAARMAEPRVRLMVGAVLFRLRRKKGEGGTP